MINPPQKLIKVPKQVEPFLHGETIKEYFEFVLYLQKSVEGKGISETKKIARFKIFDDYFEKLEKVLQDTPPLEGKMRFGNLAFRDFHPKMNDLNLSFVEGLLKSWKIDLKFTAELVIYLNDSYGDQMRVDYGTGHELNFMLFLFCLNKLEKFAKEESPALVHQIFYKYMFTIRKIQLQYKLEPAGSHGVWGLDDYHFLPFIFGAAELIGNETVRLPKDIHNTDYLEMYKHEYMYLNCIAFIKSVKKGSFGAHSPYLNDISSAMSWTKVAQGMVKMYRVDVFSKFPVMKHVRFGELFPFK